MASRRDARNDWLTASEVAEYVYCPRSWWYRTDPPPGGSGPAYRSRRAMGERYHERTLRAEARRDSHAGLYGAVLAAAIVMLLVGGLWLYLR